MEEAAFRLLWKMAKNGGGVRSGRKMFERLVELGMDDICDGFWLYDFPFSKEYYSEKFRGLLGFSGQFDFPNRPESWQLQLKDPDDLGRAMKMLKEHIDSKGEKKYKLEVDYWNKKRDNVIRVICSGYMIEWGSHWRPGKMLGIHQKI